MINSPKNIWIIDDDQSIRWVLDKSLQKANYTTLLFESASKALIQLKKGAQPDCILCDLRMPGIDGFEFLKQVKKIDTDLPIIIMTAYSDLDTTVKAYQDGAFEYLTKPFDIKDVVQLTNRACLQTHHNILKPNQSFTLSDEIIGDSPAMQDVFRIIGRLSKSHISVLIEGETGTGKELVAHAIHMHSPRHTEVFQSINIAAIPNDALEKELFGCDDEVNQPTIGLIEKANLGTLFIDDIADMSTQIQSRLLRVLTDSELYRVGGSSPITVDIRVIAATHLNLKKLVDNGLFRNDVYHRLNAIRLQLPPLRDRQTDIPLLLNHYLQLSAKELNEPLKKLSPDVSEYLATLDWPGNVRQIENTCRWLTVMSSGNEITMEDLPEELLSQEISQQNSSLANQNQAPISSLKSWNELLSEWSHDHFKQGKVDIIKEAGELFERTLLLEALKITKGRKQEAARLIGWGRNTITRKIKELKVDEN